MLYIYMYMKTKRASPSGEAPEGAGEVPEGGVEE